MQVERRDAADRRGVGGEATAAREEADVGGVAGRLHQGARGEAEEVGAVAEEDVARAGAGVQRVQRQAAGRDGDGAGQLEVLRGGGLGVGGQDGGGGVVVVGEAGLVELADAQAGHIGGELVATHLDPAGDDVVDQHRGRVAFPRRDDDAARVQDTRGALDVDRAVDGVLEVGQRELDRVGAGRRGGQDVDVGTAFGEGHDADGLGGDIPIAADELELGGAEVDRRVVRQAVVVAHRAAAEGAARVVVEDEATVVDVDRRGAGEAAVGHDHELATVDEGRAGVGVVREQGRRGGGDTTAGEAYGAGDDAGEVAGRGVRRVDHQRGVAARRGDARAGVRRDVVLEHRAHQLGVAVQVEGTTGEGEVAVGLLITPDGVGARAQLDRALVDRELAGEQVGAVQDDRTGAGLGETDGRAAAGAREGRVQGQGLARVHVQDHVGRRARGEEAVVDGRVGRDEDAATGTGRAADREGRGRGQEERGTSVELEGVDLEGRAEVGGRRGQADVLVLVRDAEVLGVGQRADVAGGGRVGREGLGFARRAVAHEDERQRELVVHAVRAGADAAGPARAVDRGDVRAGGRAGRVEAGPADEHRAAHVGGFTGEGAEGEGRADRGGRGHHREGGRAAGAEAHRAEGLGRGGGRRGGVQDQFAADQGQGTGRTHQVVRGGALDDGQLAAGTEGDGAGAAEGDAVDVGVARADIERAGHRRVGEVEVDRAGAELGERAGAGDGRGAEVDDAGAARVGVPAEVGAGGHAAVEVEGRPVLGADDRAGGADGDRATDRGSAAGQRQEGAGEVLAAGVDRDPFGRVADGRARGHRGRDVVVDRDARVRGDGRDVRVRGDVGAGDGQADHVAGGVRHRDDAVAGAAGAGGRQGERARQGDARGELEGGAEVVRDGGAGGAGAEGAVAGHLDDALVDVEGRGESVGRRQHQRARVALGDRLGGVRVDVPGERQGLARDHADFAAGVERAEVAGRRDVLGRQDVATLDVDDVGGGAEGAVAREGEHTGVDVDRAGEVVRGVVEEERARAVLGEAEAVLDVRDLTRERHPEVLQDRRGGHDVEVGVRPEVRGAGDFQAVDAVVVDEHFRHVRQVQRGDLGRLVLRRREEGRAGVGAVGDRAEVDVGAAGDGDRDGEVDGGGDRGAEAVGAVGRAGAERAVEEEVEVAAVEVDHARGRTGRGRVADELEGRADVDRGGAVGVGAGEDEAAGVRLHQDAAGEGVGAGEAQGAEAGLGDPTRAREPAGDVGVDGRGAVLDLEGAGGAGAEGDRVDEGERAGRARGREDEGRGVGEEAVRAPGQLGRGAAEVDGAVRADGAEATGGGELDLAGARADGAAEVAEGELDRAAREVEVVEAAGGADAARQGAGGGETDGARVHERLAGVAVDAGEGQGTEAGLGQAAGAGEGAGEGRVDRGRAVGDVDGALRGAEEDRVGEGDVVGRRDVGQEQRGTVRDEAARTPIEDDAGGAEVDDAVGVEGVEAGRAGELRLVGRGAEGAGEVAEAEAELAGGERHVAGAADPVRATREGQLGGEDQVAAVDEGGAGEDVGAGEREGFRAVLHEAAGAGEVDVDGAGLRGDLGGRERAAREAAAGDEEVVGRELAVEVEHAAGDGHGAGAEGRDVAHREGTRGDGGAAGVGVGRGDGPEPRPTLRHRDRGAVGVADDRGEDGVAGVGAGEDEGAGAGAGVGDGAGAGEGQGIGSDARRDVDHAAGGAEGEETVGRGGDTGVEQVAAVEDEIQSVAGRGADRADQAAVLQGGDREDTAADHGATGVGVADVAEDEGAEAILREVGGAGDDAAEGQGDVRDHDIEGVGAVGRQGDGAVEGEVVEAAEGQAALDLGGVVDREGGATGEQQGVVGEDQVTQADRAGRRGEADGGRRRAGVDVEARTRVDGEVAGEDAGAAEGEHAAAVDRDGLVRAERVAQVGEVGRDVEGRLPRRDDLTVERDRVDGDGRRGAAEVEGAADAAADGRDRRGVLAGGDEAAGQGQGAGAEGDGRAGRGGGERRAVPATFVVADVVEGQARQGGGRGGHRQGRLAVEDDAVGGVDLAGAAEGQVRDVERDGGDRRHVVADVRGGERVAQREHRVGRVGRLVDRRDGRAQRDAGAGDHLADGEAGRAGDRHGRAALEAARGHEGGRAGREDGVGAAQDDVAVVEDRAARVGVGTGQGRRVISEISRTRGVRVVEQEADGTTGVVDHGGADIQLATRGAGSGVAELVEVQVAADARGTGGQVAVADDEVGAVEILGEHEAAADEGERLAAQAQRLGARGVAVHPQGIGALIGRQGDARLGRGGDVVGRQRGQQVVRRVDLVTGGAEGVDADAVDVGGPVALVDRPRADDVVGQRRRGDELDATRVAEGRGDAVEVDHGVRTRRAHEGLGDEVDGVDVHARTGLERGVDEVHPALQDDAADGLDGGGVGVVREVQRTTAHVDVDVVGHAVAEAGITVVLDAEAAEVEVDRGGAGDGAAVLQVDRAAVDGEATREGVRGRDDDAARARLDEVDGARDGAAVGAVVEVGLVDRQVGRVRAGDIAGGARDLHEVGARQAQQGLGVAAEIQGRARVDDHRGRGRQGVHPAVEDDRARLDRGVARGTRVLLAVEDQRAVEVLVPTVGRVDRGPVDREGRAGRDEEAGDDAAGVDDDTRADGGVARGQQHARAGEVQGLETGEDADGGVGELERVDLGEARQLGVGRLVEERRGGGGVERAGGDVVRVAVDARRRGQHARGVVAREVGAGRVRDDRARDDAVRQRRVGGGEEQAVLLGAEGVARVARSEEGEVVDVAAEGAEDQGRARRGGVDADDGVAGGGGEVAGVVLGDEGLGVAGVAEGAAQHLDAAVDAEATGDGDVRVVEPGRGAVVGSQVDAGRTTQHAALGDLPGAGVVVDALRADREETVGRLDVDGPRAEVLDLVVGETGAHGRIQALAGDRDVARAGGLEALGGGEVDAAGQDEVARDRPDGGVVVDVDDAGDGVRTRGVGEVAGELDAAVEDVAQGREVEVLRQGDATRELEGGVDAAGDGDRVVAGAEGGGVRGDDHALGDREGAVPIRVRGREDEGTDVLLRQVRGRGTAERRVDREGLARGHLDPGVAHQADGAVAGPGIHRAEARATGAGDDELVGGIAQGGVRGGRDVAAVVGDQVARERVASVGQHHRAGAVLDDVTRAADQAGEHQPLVDVGLVGGGGDDVADAAVEGDRTGLLVGEARVVGERDVVAGEGHRRRERDDLVHGADGEGVGELRLDDQRVVGVARGVEGRGGRDALRGRRVVAHRLDDEAGALVKGHAAVVDDRREDAEVAAAALVDETAGPAAGVAVEVEIAGTQLGDRRGAADGAEEVELVGGGDDGAVRAREGDGAGQDEGLRARELEVALDDDRVGDGAEERGLAAVVLGGGRGRVEVGVDARGRDGQGAGAERAGEDVVAGVDDGVRGEGQRAFGQGDATGEGAGGRGAEGGVAGEVEVALAGLGDRAGAGDGAGKVADLAVRHEGGDAGRGDDPGAADGVVGGVVTGEGRRQVVAEGGDRARQAGDVGAGGDTGAGDGLTEGETRGGGEGQGVLTAGAGGGRDRGLRAVRHEGEGAGGEGGRTDVEGATVDAGGGSRREGRGATEGDRAARDVERAAEGVDAREGQLAGAGLGQAARAGDAGGDGEDVGRAEDGDDGLVRAEGERAAGDVGGDGGQDRAGAVGQGEAGLGEVRGRAGEHEGVHRVGAGLGRGGREVDVRAVGEGGAELVGRVERAETAGGGIGDEGVRRAGRGAQATGGGDAFTQQPRDDLGVLDRGVDAGAERGGRADERRGVGDEGAGDRGGGRRGAAEAETVDEGDAAVGAGQGADGQGREVGRAVGVGQRAETTAEGQRAERLGRVEEAARVARDDIGALEEEGRAGERDRDGVGDAVGQVGAGAGVVDGQVGVRDDDAGGGGDRAEGAGEGQGAGGDVGRAGVGVGVLQDQRARARQDEVARAADHAGEGQHVVTLDRGAGIDGDVGAERVGAAGLLVKTTASQHGVAGERDRRLAGPRSQGPERVDRDRTGALERTPLEAEEALLDDDIAGGNVVATRRPGVAPVHLGQGVAVEVEHRTVEVHAVVTTDGGVAAEHDAEAHAVVGSGARGHGDGREAVVTRAGDVDELVARRADVPRDVERGAGGKVGGRPQTRGAKGTGGSREDAALVDEEVAREGVGGVELDAAVAGDRQVPCPADDAGLDEAGTGDIDGRRAVDRDGVGGDRVDGVRHDEGRATAQGDRARTVGVGGRAGDEGAVGDVERTGEGGAVDAAQRDGPRTGDGEGPGGGVVREDAGDLEGVAGRGGADDELAAGGGGREVAAGERGGVAAVDQEARDVERAAGADGDGVVGGGGATEGEGVEGAAFGQREGRRGGDVVGGRGPRDDGAGGLAVERGAEREDVAGDGGDRRAGGDARAGDGLADGEAGGGVDLDGGVAKVTRRRGDGGGLGGDRGHRAGGGDVAGVGRGVAADITGGVDEGVVGAVEELADAHQGVGRGAGEDDLVGGRGTAGEGEVHRRADRTGGERGEGQGLRGADLRRLHGGVATGEGQRAEGLGGAGGQGELEGRGAGHRHRVAVGLQGRELQRALADGEGVGAEVEGRGEGQRAATDLGQGARAEDGAGVVDVVTLGVEQGRGDEGRLAGEGHRRVEAQLGVGVRVDVEGVRGVAERGVGRDGEGTAVQLDRAEEGVGARETEARGHVAGQRRVEEQDRVVVAAGDDAGEVDEGRATRAGVGLDQGDGRRRRAEDDVVGEVDVVRRGDLEGGLQAEVDGRGGRERGGVEDLEDAFVDVGRAGVVVDALQEQRAVAVLGEAGGAEGNATVDGEVAGAAEGQRGVRAGDAGRVGQGQRLADLEATDVGGGGQGDGAPERGGGVAGGLGERQGALPAHAGAGDRQRLAEGRDVGEEERTAGRDGRAAGDVTEGAGAGDEQLGAGGDGGRAGVDAVARERGDVVAVARDGEGTGAGDGAGQGELGQRRVDREGVAGLQVDAVGEDAATAVGGGEGRVAGGLDDGGAEGGVDVGDRELAGGEVDVAAQGVGGGERQVVAVRLLQGAGAGEHAGEGDVGGLVDVEGRDDGDRAGGQRGGVRGDRDGAGAGGETDGQGAGAAEGVAVEGQGRARGGGQRAGAGEGDRTGRAEGQVGRGEEGAAVEGQGAHGGAEVGVGRDGEAAAVEEGAAGVGVGAGEDDRGGAGLGERARAGDDARDGRGVRAVEVEVDVVGAEREGVGVAQGEAAVGAARGAEDGVAGERDGAGQGGVEGGRGAVHADGAGGGDRVGDRQVAAGEGERGARTDEHGAGGGAEVRRVVDPERALVDVGVARVGAGAPEGQLAGAGLDDVDRGAVVDDGDARAGGAEGQRIGRGIGADDEFLGADDRHQGGAGAAAEDGDGGGVAPGLEEAVDLEGVAVLEHQAVGGAEADRADGAGALVGDGAGDVEQGRRRGRAQRRRGRRGEQRRADDLGGGVGGGEVGAVEEVAGAQEGGGGLTRQGDELGRAERAGAAGGEVDRAAVGATGQGGEAEGGVLGRDAVQRDRRVTGGDGEGAERLGLGRGGAGVVGGEAGGAAEGQGLRGEGAGAAEGFLDEALVDVEAAGEGIDPGERQGARAGLGHGEGAGDDAREREVVGVDLDGLGGRQRDGARNGQAVGAEEAEILGERQRVGDGQAGGGGVEGAAVQGDRARAGGRGRTEGEGARVDRDAARVAVGRGRGVGVGGGDEGAGGGRRKGHTRRAGQHGARGDQRGRGVVDREARARDDRGDVGVRRDVGAGDRHADIPAGGATRVGDRGAERGLDRGGRDRRGDEHRGGGGGVGGEAGAGDGLADVDGARGGRKEERAGGRRGGGRGRGGGRAEGQLADAELRDAEGARDDAGEREVVGRDGDVLGGRQGDGAGERQAVRAEEVEVLGERQRVGDGQAGGGGVEGAAVQGDRARARAGVRGEGERARVDRDAAGESRAEVGGVGRGGRDEGARGGGAQDRAGRAGDGRRGDGRGVVGGEGEGRRAADGRARDGGADVGAQGGVTGAGVGAGGVGGERGAERDDVARDGGDGGAGRDTGTGDRHARDEAGAAGDRERGAARGARRRGRARRGGQGDGGDRGARGDVRAGHRHAREEAGREVGAGGGEDLGLRSRGGDAVGDRRGGVDAGDVGVGGDVRAGHRHADDGARGAGHEEDRGAGRAGGGQEGRGGDDGADDRGAGGETGTAERLAERQGGGGGGRDRQEVAAGGGEGGRRGKGGRDRRRGRGGGVGRGGGDERGGGRVAERDARGAGDGDTGADHGRGGRAHREADTRLEADDHRARGDVRAGDRHTDIPAGGATRVRHDRADRALRRARGEGRGRVDDVGDRGARGDALPAQLESGDEVGAGGDRQEVAARDRGGGRRGQGDVGGRAQDEGAGAGLGEAGRAQERTDGQAVGGDGDRAGAAEGDEARAQVERVAGTAEGEVGVPGADRRGGQVDRAGRGVVEDDPGRVDVDATGAEGAVVGEVDRAGGADHQVARLGVGAAEGERARAGLVDADVGGAGDDAGDVERTGAVEGQDAGGRARGTPVTGQAEGAGAGVGDDAGGGVGEAVGVGGGERRDLVVARLRRGERGADGDGAGTDGGDDGARGDARAGDGHADLERQRRRAGDRRARGDRGDQGLVDVDGVAGDRLDDGTRRDVGPGDGHADGVLGGVADGDGVDADRAGGGRRPAGEEAQGAVAGDGRGRAGAHGAHAGAGQVDAAVGHGAGAGVQERVVVVAAVRVDVDVLARADVARHAGEADVRGRERARVADVDLADEGVARVGEDVRAADVGAPELVGDVADQAGVEGERAAGQHGHVRADVGVAATPGERAGAVDGEVVVGLEVGAPVVVEAAEAGAEVQRQRGDAVVVDLAEVGLTEEVDRVDA